MDSKVVSDIKKTAVINKLKQPVQNDTQKRSASKHPRHMH